MRRNNQPWWLHCIFAHFQRWYINTRIRPQFDSIGESLSIFQPRTLSVFGREIHAGHHLHIISSKVKPVSLSCWTSKQAQGEIHIGDFVLLSPGVQISSASKIIIGNNCMIGAESYISDCDWHGVYNRTRPFRCSSDVILKDNVWLGFRCIVGKGITIGNNSIVAAGSVVVEDVPDNCIVGGNPAKIIKRINPNRRMLKRDFLFQSIKDYGENQHELNRYLLHSNSTRSWLRALLAPNQED